MDARNLVYPVGLLLGGDIFPFESWISGINGLIPSSVYITGSVSWRLALTQFETAFLFLLLLNIMILRILEILPINLNLLLSGDPAGRKRRSTFGEGYCKSDPMLDSIVEIINKVDVDSCGFRFLCELNSVSPLMGPKLNPTPGLLHLIPHLKRWKEHQFSTVNGFCNLNLLADNYASLVPHTDHGNSSHCDALYPNCPLNKEDAIFYMKTFEILME